MDLAVTSHDARPRTTQVDQVDELIGAGRLEAEPSVVVPDVVRADLALRSRASRTDCEDALRYGREIF
jgi:hypothetical protein